MKNSSDPFFLPQPLTIRLRDDDGGFTPGVPSLSTTAQAFSEAYIEVLADGGGDIANNKLDVPFSLNYSGTATPLATFNSLSSRSAQYWIAYVITAFQPPTYRPASGETPALGDGDSSLESGILGLTYSTQYTAVFYETIAEAYNNKANEATYSELKLREHNIAHEIGHQLGLNHVSETSLMTASPSPTGILDNRFSGFHIKQLRNRHFGPGNG